MERPTDSREELAELIAEQERDDRWGHSVRQSGASLDFQFEGGGTFSEIVGYQTGAGDSAVRRVSRPQRWTRATIIAHIRAWAKEHGEPPKYREWVRPMGRGIPCSLSVARRFGTFNEAIRAAGFEPRRPGQCDPEDPSGRRVRQGQRRSARLTSADLAAAYVLYDRKGMSTVDLGHLLWRKYGYAGQVECTGALVKGFHAEGFRVRTRSEARLCLSDEKRLEVARKMRAGRGFKQLSADDLRTIIAMRGVERQVDLAARFGVSRSTIARIQAGA